MQGCSAFGRVSSSSFGGGSLNRHLTLIRTDDGFIVRTTSPGGRGHKVVTRNPAEAVAEVLKFLDDRDEAKE